ncbi:restriction endonuclease subunit M [Thiospirochaeta perfilievii]|uniref:site-specific DNA-methyltransferase (adenine-specific) n=1 Tax=Thiospirochaeta perfilievii TaxID=252967 RepID=A0A5C1Q6E4_9SPIO|nr:N-6 DNA methylase [Thiospirochaeta perfilievii]QEN03643.1 restriction endonuclease subunit M [Thiospirochaeta perfilievii]
MNLLTKNEAASILGISVASLKNWERHGYIKAIHNNLYSNVEVEDLKDKIRTGEIKRLDSRANKSSSRTHFIPLEYVNNQNSLVLIEDIIHFILEYNIKPSQALFLLSINALINSGDIEKSTLYKAIKFEDKSYFKRESVYFELKSWFSTISNGEIKEDNRFCKFLLEAPLPKEIDFLGIIYQSIMHEGEKSQLGSYYTPTSLVEQIVDDNLLIGKVLDPCCGTGQFLLLMAKKIGDPSRIWGADIDENAVNITRINLLLYYKDRDFKPNIYHMNSLLDFKEKNFSFIATNPPWGAKFSKIDLELLKEKYVSIQSKESFSYFIHFAINHLEIGGKYSFVLPESILYVKNHKDIRSYLLNNSCLDYIESCGRLFKNVFSSVIRLDGSINFRSKGSITTIKTDMDTYQVEGSRFLSNTNNIIDIYCDNNDQELIDKVYSYPHLTLKGRAKWALGIVTGNNSKHLSSIYKDGMEPIYKGKDLSCMTLLPPTSYINFNPQLYQQCAPIDLYRAKEKLVYKFINKELVFAYDNNKHLTLNSANIMIPKIEDIPIKVIGVILNSSLFKFIFRKKFNAIKILRSDIESLPIPILSKKQIEDLNTLAKDFINNDIDFEVIDRYISLIYDIDFEHLKKNPCDIAQN